MLKLLTAAPSGMMSVKCTESSHQAHKSRRLRIELTSCNLVTVIVPFYARDASVQADGVPEKGRQVARTP